jgi:gliding motility-associated-like protein
LNLSIIFTPNAQLQWNVLTGAALISGDQTTTPKLTGLPRGLTQIEVVATNGDCEDRYTINITVNSSDSPECRDNEIVVPKGFSPNGDGTADFFIIENLNGRSAQLQVFNRWGQKVFESSDPNARWDGRWKGREDCPEGVYYVLIKARDRKGKLYDFSTTLTLIR